MNEKEARNKIAKNAKKYMGVRGGTKAHHRIINTFNKVKPQGYTAKYSDPWCSEFASAMAIETFGEKTAKKYFPLSASCPRMIEEAKKKNIWVEKDSYKPNVGDFILYDWQDSGKGDNKNTPDHVGIVKSCKDGKIHVIEGNCGNKVSTRVLPVNGKYIRGFVTPRYDKIADKKKTVTQIANEVINGKWGVGQDRKEKLTAAGYDYDQVQHKVNDLLKKETE